MPKAKEHSSTPASDDPPPPSETWLRVLAPSFETEAGWQDRDPVSRAMFAVSGAADRLDGLSQICWGLCLAETLQGGRSNVGPRKPYAFLAKTLGDIARGLNEADRLYRVEMDREDVAALRSSKRAAK